MTPGQEVKLAGDFFKLHYIENEGAAFGLTLTDLTQEDTSTENMGMERGKLWLTLISFGSCLLILFLVVLLRNVSTRLPTLMAVVLGGAMGNMVDRIFYGLWFARINDYEGGMFYGRVVDIFHFDWWQGKLPEWLPLVGSKQFAMWPVFNLADAAILLGIAGVMWQMFRTFTRSETQKSG